MNAYSIKGIANAFRSLHKNNFVMITSAYGDDHDDLASAVMDILKGMKANYICKRIEQNFLITISE